MTVGCEVETNLRARDSRDDISRFGNDEYALTDFASNVCDIFNTKMSERRNGVRMRVKGDPRYPQEYSIGLWTIERDGSIRKDNSQQVSLEIVSPIMICDLTEMWRKDVESMYKYIGGAFYFEANESCGLHVHMKPSLRWNMTDLRALCKAIVYFERNLQALLPSHRASRNMYCKQNYSENPQLSSLDIGRCFDAINGMRGLEDLKLVMNADGAGDHTRYYAWNFTNLKFNQQTRGVDGTVEYRNPPFANDGRTCTAWMTLATTFAGAARRAAREDAKIRREFGQDLRGLKSFLEYGSESWTRKADYLSLFPGESSGSSRSSTSRARMVEPSSSRTSAPRVEVRRSRNGEVRLERRT